MASSVTLRVFRWAPDQPERWQEYRVSPGADTTVLDALVEIQRTQDPTLAFRYACRVGMCGSCAVVVNGRERWACRTRISGLGGRPLSVRPLYHFPLLRDLVVDMTPFSDQLGAVGAAFGPRPSAPAYEAISRDAAERREIDGALEGIRCGIFVSACTLGAAHERFSGPAGLTPAFTPPPGSPRG